MKTVIITGANGNLGAVTVKLFLEKGYRVVAVARSGSELGFAHDHKNFELHQLNLTDESAVILFTNQAIQLYGSVDAGIFLAGGFSMDNAATITVTALRKMVSLNFETALTISRTLFQHMLNTGYGRLIFIGAKPALNPTAAEHSLGYALSKSLLFEYAQILNAQAKGKNVTASVVVPSVIDTPSNRESMPDADFNKWVRPEELAGVFELICSDAGNSLREPVLKMYNNA